MAVAPHGLLLVDKPSGMTSHDIVGRVRRLLETKKAGHAGTLDPAAEGLVVVAVGAATRLLPYLTGASKEYIAHVVLGCSSDTADVEGRMEAGSEARRICRADRIEEALRQQVGSIQQIPPAHSAIKLDGQPLYRRARRGEMIQVPARAVTIYAIDLLDYCFPDVIIRLNCSSGTYVRSVARDLGVTLGTGAYLHHLLRTRVGDFELRYSWSLAELEQSLSIETWASFGLNPASPFLDWLAVIADPVQERSWYDGRPITNSPAAQSSAATHASVYDAHGDWMGLAERDPEGRGWHPKLVVAGARRTRPNE